MGAPAQPAAEAAHGITSSHRKRTPLAGCPELKVHGKVVTVGLLDPGETIGVRGNSHELLEVPQREVALVDILHALFEQLERADLCRSSHARPRE
jgi:hypothetical protein